MSRQQRPTKPATEKPQAQKPATRNPSAAGSALDTAAAGSAPDTAAAAGDLMFEDPAGAGPLIVVEGNAGIPTDSRAAGPLIVVQADPGIRPDSRAAAEFAERETIHASECVVNSECTLTRGCRGRLKATNAVSGKVQIYCPKCSQFAAGTRPAHQLVSGSGAKLFDRVTGK